jgi:hypothetical protein
LTGERRAGARPGDRDFSERLDLQPDRVRRPVYGNERVVGGEAPRGHRGVPLPGLELGELPDHLASGQRRLELGRVEGGERPPGDVPDLELDTEDECREHHQLGHRVESVDIVPRIALRQTRLLRLGQRLRVAAPDRDPRADEVDGRIQNPAEPDRLGAAEPRGERSEHRRPRHHRGLDPKARPVSLG